MGVVLKNPGAEARLKPRVRVGYDNTVAEDEFDRKNRHPLIDIDPGFTAEGMPSYHKRICWGEPDQEFESKLEHFWRAVLGPEPAQASSWTNAVVDTMPSRHTDIKCFETAKLKGPVGLTDAAVSVGDVVCGL